MPYRQITQDERYRLSQLLCLPLSLAAIARLLGRHRSSIHRELARNRRARDRYEWYHADRLAVTRRSHSRRNRRLTRAHWAIVERYLAVGWSPEQIAGRWQVRRRRWISHEAIYQYLARDRQAGGHPLPLAPAGPQDAAPTVRPPAARRAPRALYYRASRYRGAADAAGALGTRYAAGGRARLPGDRGRKRTGYAVIGKLEACTTAALVARVTQLLRHQPHPVRTNTADNGSEMTGYRSLEQALGARFYFTQPDSAWQRGSIEHLTGLTVALQT